MMAGRNHYKVLGVSPDADLSQIRAAYVALLKRFHPDLSDASNAQENGAQIHRIVGAYRTLKDPQARAAYDRSLRQIAPSNWPFRAAPPHAAPVRRAGRRLRLDRDTISCVLMLIAAAVGLQLLVSRFLELRWSQSAPTTLAGTSSVRDAAAQARLEAVVRNAGMMSGTEASNYSSRCFAAARRVRNSAAADPCVGFDMAFVYWRETMGGPIVADPYFQPEAMSSRVKNAFGGLSPIGAAAHVQSIREATRRAILQMPRAANDLTLASSAGQAEVPLPRED
jgi:hypothetical protein